MKEIGIEELTVVNGGEIQFVKWFKGTIWFIAVSYVIDHWAELKSGIVDGYTDAMKDK